MKHLAIMDKHTINMILNSEKTIETRFSKNKISPYHKVKVGEIVYLKESGKDITASFEIAKVIFYENLTGDKVKEIKQEYNHLIKAPNLYWDIKSASKYGTLMFIKNVIKLNNQIKINKKGRQGFVSYDKII